MDFCSDEICSFFEFVGQLFIDRDILSEGVAAFLPEFFYSCVELYFSLVVDLELAKDRLQGFSGQFFGPYDLDEIGNIIAFEFLHGVQKAFLLDISIDAESSGQFLDLFVELCAGFGEDIPVDKGFGAY